MLPLLSAGRLRAAWRAWNLQRDASKNWQLGSHKSPAKWSNRLEKGNWTPEKISRTIKDGEPYDAPNKVNPPNGATGYELGKDFIVRDDETGDILQVSRPGQVPEKLR